MSVIGEFSIRASSFTLGETLSAEPDVVVEAERMASHSTMQVMPFLWGTGCEADAFRDVLEADPTVEEAHVSEDTGDGVLYKMIWGQDFRNLIDSVVDHHGSLLEATGTDGVWNLKLRFAEKENVPEFQDNFRDRGHHFEVKRLYQPSSPRQGEYNLTPEQRDTLVAAFRAGYFEVPRRTSAGDLAEELGISTNAVSARLRRGSANLVDNSLVIDSDGTGSE